ncbi:MAG: hypothetical protein SH857_03315 [Chitinophagales bacterium]|nr:hypothetical protein [Chitinophagales bacterium]
MKRIILVGSVAVAALLSSCSTAKICSNCGKKCETATLFYLPDCKEIKGYVNFDESGIQRVLKHDIPQEFQKDSIRVCIKYENVGVGILMSDCMQSEIIRIKCMEKK